MSRILIIQTGKSAGKCAYGTYADMFIDVMKLKESEVESIDLKNGELPKEHSAYKGVIITGSPAMITEDKSEKWYSEMEKWLKEAVEAKLPVLGICYGHQMLAQMLGGKVEYLPQAELGTISVKLTGTCGLLKGMPDSFLAQATHSQTVTQLPESAEALGHSDMDKCQVAKYSDTVFSVQFHPEFSAETMITRIKARCDADPGLPGIYMEKIAAVKDTPDAAKILSNFQEML